MELLVPSLAALLFGIAIAFFVIPKLAPTMLFSGSAVVLVLAVYLHYSKFGKMEYDQSTWQNNFRTYAKYILLLIVLGAAYMMYAQNYGTASISWPKSGGGLDSVVRTATSRINELLRKGRISI
jgi:hypothetical protein